MVRHSQFQMPNPKWGASILCRSKMADLVPLTFAHKIAYAFFPDYFPF